MSLNKLGTFRSPTYVHFLIVLPSMAMAEALDAALNNRQPPADKVAYSAAHDVWQLEYITDDKGQVHVHRNKALYDHGGEKPFTIIENWQNTCNQWYRGFASGIRFEQDRQRAIEIEASTTKLDDSDDATPAVITDGQDAKPQAAQPTAS